MEKRSLQGKKVAVLATDGFEESEFTEPIKALKDAGATVEVVSLKEGDIKAWSHTDWGGTYKADKAVADVQSSEYDALVLPGGVMNPDKLRTDPEVIAFVRQFGEDSKPIAAICHGPWTLIEAGIAKGRQMTSWPSLQTDLTNAGATWIDREVVVDNGLVTSRKPDDLPAFNKKMIEEIAEGRHTEKRTQGVHQLG
ncbi:type 1 glutamine amidotransferase domain-containing protein [Chitinophaga lutea]